MTKNLYQAERELKTWEARWMPRTLNLNRAERESKALALLAKGISSIMPNGQVYELAELYPWLLTITSGFNGFFDAEWLRVADLIAAHPDGSPAVATAIRNAVPVRSAVIDAAVKRVAHQYFAL